VVGAHGALAVIVAVTALPGGVFRFRSWTMFPDVVAVAGLAMDAETSVKLVPEMDGTVTFADPIIWVPVLLFSVTVNAVVVPAPTDVGVTIIVNGFLVEAA
jgi:hypothetical protein